MPKTWADWRALSKEFTVWEGDKLKSVGYLPSSIDAVQLNIFSALNGGQLFDGATGRFTVDSPQNVEMLQFLLDWFNEEYKGDLTKVTSSANFAFYPDGDGRAPEFQNGNMAMGSDGFWVSGDMYNVELKQEAANWNATSYPVGPSGTGAKSGYWPNWMVIPKGSKRPVEGFAYMDYMSAKGIVSWFDAAADLPINKNVDVGALLPRTLAARRDPAFARDILAFFFHQLDVATPMWLSPVQNFANDQMTRMLEQVWTKNATPKDALAEAQKSCQAELDKVVKAQAQ